MQTSMLLTVRVVVNHPEHRDPEEGFIHDFPDILMGRGCQALSPQIIEIEKEDPKPCASRRHHRSKRKVG